MPAGRDSADVPEGRRLRIEIGGADEQQAPALVGFGKVGQHLFVDMQGDHFQQRRGIRHRVP